MSKTEKEMQIEELERKMADLSRNFCVVVKATVESGTLEKVNYWSNPRAERMYNEHRQERDKLIQVQQ